MQKTKILNYIETWTTRCYDSIPDELPHKVEQSLRAPSYKAICRSILKNDLHCTSLGYSKPSSCAVETAKRIHRAKIQPELF